MEYVSRRQVLESAAIVGVGSQGLMDSDTAHRRPDESPIESVAPESKLTVQPDTTVLFEVEGDLDPGEIDWYLDGEYEATPMGEWQWEYPTSYWQHSFDSEGTYEVTAIVKKTDDYRATWSVDVRPDGASPPSIDGIRPDPGETLRGDRSQTLELDVSDDDELDRVVWWVTHHDVLLDSTDLSGPRGTASLQFDGCDVCSIVVWVVDETNLVAEREVWELSTALQDQHTLEARKDGVEDGLAYFLAVADEVTGHDEDGIQTPTAALDWLGPARGTDAYDVAGELDTFLLKGPAEVRWNGTTVDPETLGSPKSGGGVRSADHSIRVESTGTGFGIYAITASEGIEAIDSEATTDGYSVIDHVGPERGVDEFLIEGEITRFLSNDHLRVYLDDVRVDPQTL